MWLRPQLARSPNIATTLETLGLAIPPGVITPGSRQTVLTRDASGRGTVGRLHVRVGENAVVLLPDGQLVLRPSDELQPTAREFEPASKDSVAAALSTSLPGEFRVKQTRRYVYLYRCSDRFAKVASRILETMYRGIVAYAEHRADPVHEPETPLVVIIFQTREQFLEYRRMPDGVVAFYDVMTNRVTMYEDSGLWKLNPQLLDSQALATVAHEGAHQVLHNIGVQQRLSVWPTWLNEGLAEFFSATETDRQLRWKGAGQVNDMRMVELAEWFQNRTVDEDVDGQLIAQTIGAARLTSAGYAAAWGLTHYLAKNHREAFHALVHEYSQLGPLEACGRVVPPGMVPENVPVFKKHFGDDLADAERCVLLHLSKLPYSDPRPHFVGMVEATTIQGRRDANVFRTAENAEICVPGVHRTVSPAQRRMARTKVVEFSNRESAEAHAWQWLQGG